MIKLLNGGFRKMFCEHHVNVISSMDADQIATVFLSKGGIFKPRYYHYGSGLPDNGIVYKDGKDVYMFPCTIK